MSRRRVAGVVATALAAGSLMAGSPAHAGPGDPVGCIQAPPSGGSYQSIVYVNGLDVSVYPTGHVNATGLANYAVQVALVPYRYVWCVEGDVLDPVFCPVSNIGSTDEYVYVDEWGGVHVRGNELAADATACL